MKKCLVFLFALIVTGCWFDVNNESWQPDLIVCSQGNTLDFGSESTELPLHYEYRGDFTSEYTISSNVDWLSVCDFTTGTPLQSGLLDPNNNNVDFKVVIDRSKLNEGNNSAEMKFTVEDIYRKLYVSAYSRSEVSVTPKSLNFGLSSSRMDLYASVKAAGGLIYVSTDAGWLSVSPLVINAAGVAAGKEVNETITVSCDRGSLKGGLHEGSVYIKSEKLTFIEEIPVTVYVSEQDEMTQEWGDFLFTISETPYRTSAGDVVVKLNIKNVSNIYSSLSFNAKGTKAYDPDDNVYSTLGDRVLLIKPEETITLSITFLSVPESVVSFSKILLDFTETKIQFDEISF